MTKDTMRHKFEAWAEDKDFSLITKHLAWLAYAQGQRDLIEAMDGTTIYTKLLPDDKPCFILPEGMKK